MSNASPAMHAAHEAKREARRERQDRVISLLGDGLNIQQACDAVGIQRRTFYQWIERYSDFRSRRDEAVRKSHENSGKLREQKFAEFRLRHFGMRTFWHQQKMVDAIESCPGGGIIMILLPPEWGKTTLIEDYFCYRIAKNPNIRIVHMSQSQRFSRKIVGRLERRMLKETSSFVQRYGPFKADLREDTKPWNADFFTVAGSDHDERDYTLESRGATSQIQGSRAELIVLDDIQSQKTLSQTESIIDHIRQEIITRPGKDGHIIVIGTRVGFGDVYEKMIEEDMIDRLVLIPALDDDGHSNFPPQFDEEGRPILDERGNQLGWSEEDLDRRAYKLGGKDGAIWNRTYMQKPVSKMGMPFTEEMLQAALDRDRTLTGPAPGPGMIGGLDPALGGHAAYVVASYSSEKLWLVDIEDHEGLGRTEQLLAYLTNLSLRHNPSAWVIETEAMQKGLARDQRLYDLADELGFYVHEHTTRGQKFDSAIGIASMATMFKQGRIRIPYGDENARRQSDMLLEQLRKWRPDIPTKLLRQDLVMALWFVYLRWTVEKDTLATTASNWKRAGVPGAPTAIPWAA